MNNSEINFPDSWIAIPVSDAVISISTNGKKIPQKQYIPNGSLPVIDQGQDYIGGYTDNMAMKVECELPVIVFGDHTRIVKYVNIAFAPGADGVKVLQPQKFIYPKLLNYFVQYLTSNLTNHGYARHYQHLSKETLPVPPLNEQQRILAKIEELLSELDKGIENLKTAQAQLKVYRQALLKHAFEGKLTAQWRAENQDKLETAEALLKRIQQERAQRYQQQLADWETSSKQGSKPKAPKHLPPLAAEELAKLPELPEGWLWTKLGNIFCENPKNGIYKSGELYGEGVSIIRIDDFYDGSLIRTEDFKKVKLSASEFNSFTANVGDILINRVNSIEYLGKCCEIKGLKEKVVFESNIMKTRVSESLVSNFFITSYLSSYFGRRRLCANAKHAVNQASINQTDVSMTPIPLAQLIEQSVISESLEAKLSEIDQLDQTITTSLQQAGTLRQSILKKAFSGQLVPQDPNDQSASELLARIKTEQQAQSKQKNNKN